MSWTEEVRWSRNFFDTLALGAIWSVPRSAIVFQKVSVNELAIHSMMPYSEDIAKAFAWGFDVPPDKEHLRKAQQSDFEAISERFKAAGINVTDPKGLLHD